jgi:hypothetical protein
VERNRRRVAQSAMQALGVALTNARDCPDSGVVELFESDCKACCAVEQLGNTSGI